MTQRSSMYLSARRSYVAEFSETFRDFISAFLQTRLAFSLAVHDIAARYRGSILGPWWITLSMAALVVGIGVNYSVLFHVSTGELLPYVAIGIVVWGFISSCITEGGEAFVAGAAMLRQSSIPLPVFLWRTVLRNLINLAHHVVIIVAVLAYVGHFPGLGVLWSVMGLVLAILNLTWVMTLMAFLCSRFRDVPQIISAVLQITFFLTPIFWTVPPQMAKSPNVIFNPFYYAVEAVRRPLVGAAPPLDFYFLLASVALVGWLVAIVVYNQTRRRVVHYL
jgi:ABC-type polysaccharide/polyol phosphate export permease